MKTNIDHLSSEKQQELLKVVEVIHTHIPNAAMIILFGSYARGDWVEEYWEDGIHPRYLSDFDLLVVVETRSIREQSRLADEIENAMIEMSPHSTPVSVIAHDIEFLNRHLENAQYFFIDIKKEGVLLYDSGKFKLSEPRELTAKDRYHLAKEDFEQWFVSAEGFFKTFEFALSQKNYAIAAFLLHQVTERLYTAILLVFTRYKPNSHKLKYLRTLVNAIDPRFIRIFEMNNAQNRRRFILLCDAYIKARYNKEYKITEEELVWLKEQVKELEQLTQTLCQEKIATFLQNTL